VFAQSHRPNTCGGVCVVGGADGDRVNLVSHYAQQLAVVVKRLRVWVLPGLLLQSLVVDVTERDDIAIAGCAVGVAGALAANSDASNVHLVIGRPAPDVIQLRTKPETSSGQCGRVTYEPTTIDLRGHNYVFP
jgi:hypothetical protein